MAGDEATKLNEAMNNMAVAPPQVDEEHPIVLQRSAGTDGTIRERLETNPHDCDAKVDEGSDESMDASDPVAASLPGTSGPAPSSSFPDEGVPASDMPNSAS